MVAVDCQGKCRNDQCTSFRASLSNTINFTTPLYFIQPDTSLPCQPVSDLCPIRGRPRFSWPIGRVADWQVSLVRYSVAKYATIKIVFQGKKRHERLDTQVHTSDSWTLVGEHFSRISTSGQNINQITFSSHRRRIPIIYWSDDDFHCYHTNSVSPFNDLSATLPEPWFHKSHT